MIDFRAICVVPDMRAVTLSPSTVVGPLAASTTYLQLSSRATFSSITSGTAAGMKMSHCSFSMSSMVMGSPAKVRPSLSFAPPLQLSFEAKNSHAEVKQGCACKALVHCLPC